MPGLVGLVTRMPRAEAEVQLRTMLGAMCHDRTYATSTWTDGEIGVYVAKTARAGSFSDAPPQQNASGDVTLLFSGEEYPSADVVRRARRGVGEGAHRSAYLVGVYDTDPAFPAALNGLFHGLVVDRRSKTATLFNDRYGMHRLYVYETADAVYFAAEAKALLAVRPELRQLDPRGLAETILLGCSVDNRTVFSGLTLLPGGSAWTFERGRLTRRAQYFRPHDWEKQATVTAEEFYRQVREVYTRNLDLYFDGPERVGVSLTGGLDSRMIMAWQRKASGSLPTYTWGGPDRDCRDVTIARDVARICGQPHHVIPLGQAFLDRFADYANRAVFLTDGLVDTGLAPDVYWNEAAREIAPIRLTGLYGGEVLRRHLAFKPVLPLAGLFAGDVESRFDEAQQAYQQVRGGHPLTFAVFRQAPWHHYGSFSLEQTQVGMRTPFLDNDLVEAVYRAPDLAVSTNTASMQLIADGSLALAKLPTDRGLGGRGGWSERLSRTAQEVLFKAEYCYDYGMPQWLAKFDYRVRALHMERLFLGRHRPHYFRLWYRDQLSSYVRDMLLDRKALARPYLNRAFVQTMIEAHVRGDRNYTTEIHKLLRLELLHRHFIDAPVAVAPHAEPLAVHA